MKSLLAFCLAACIAFADEVWIEKLQGILLLPSWEEVRKEPIDGIQTVMADGVTFLQLHPEYVRDLYNDYIGRPFTKEMAREIEKRITKYYREKNQPLVVVSVPKQEVAKSVLQVVVEEGKLGKVTLAGNGAFPIRWFADELRVTPGRTVIMKDLVEDIAWLNLNPFRRTDLVIRPGAKADLIDLELVTVDRWPARVYTGGDNTGTDDTNRNRLFLGFNFGKSVLKDGQISYQFTCAPNWNLFYSHTASARLPLPWRHIWMLWGGYAQVQPYRSVPSDKNTGFSWQVDTRYRIPFFPSIDTMHTFVLGYDFKETNNVIRANHTDIFQSTADINQFMLGYELGYRSKSTRLSLLAEVYGNPGGITLDNKTEKYQALQPGARSEYFYGKLAHSWAMECKHGWLTYDITAQASSCSLLPSEQMTMTGYGAVRGFEERILNLDNAVLGSFSLETKRMSIAKVFGYRRAIDELYALAFVDGGLGSNHSGATKFCTLASVGPGLRYQISRYFSARLDYGFQLGHSGFANPSHSRYNFGMILSY